MSSSHWMFWVARARFEVRFLNRLVESSGSLPARSLAPLWTENQVRKAAPRGDRLRRHSGHATATLAFASAVAMARAARIRVR
jgi:hypothetical protein